MSTFWVHLDEDEINRVKRELVATHKQINIAMHRALRVTARKIRTKASKDLRLKLKVPSRIWKDRLRLYVRQKEGIYRIWFGLDPISLSRLNPRQTKRGVSAQGRVRRKGAFISKGGKNKGLVFKRKGRERLPIDKQEFEVEEDVLIYIEDEIFPAFEEMFYQVFEKELRWETDAENPKNKK